MERSVEQLQLLQGLRPEAQLIAARALDSVDANYSYSGDSHIDPIADLYMPYHNGTHTRNVMRDTLWLCGVFGLEYADRETAVLAASAHDISHDFEAAYGESEAKSADWLDQQMAPDTSILMHPDDIFTKTQRAYARLAIAGTIVKMEAGAYPVITQNATSQDYPSKRAQTIAHIVAASDLGRFCRPDGPAVSHRYHQELTTGASGKAPAIDQRLINYHKHQAEITAGRSYTYPTPLLDKAMATHRPEVHAYNIAMIADLEAGRIESWQDVLQKDAAFAILHS
jgi:hypothetical protein